MRRFVQVRVRVPVTVQELLTDWWMARGALGVQEDHPGLRPADGPLVSGNPAEWAGSALPNPSQQVTLTGWFEEPATPEGERLALQAFLSSFQAPGDRAPEVEGSWVEERDWNAEWKASWKPVVVGRIHVVPTWLEVPEAAHGVVLRLDPGMAFGTGTHATTATCLEFVQEVLESRDPAAVDVLDVGTGSGILALAALALGARTARGIDLDPDALARAGENARCNAMEDRLHLSSAPLSGEEGPFSLVLANLLAPVIMHLAGSLARVTAPGGLLVTSGVLEDQQQEVARALMAQDLRPRETRLREGWVTSLWQRP